MVKQNKSGSLLVAAFLAAAVLGVTPVGLKAQQQEERSTPNASAGKRVPSSRSWRVRVVLSPLVTITLRAKNAPLAAIMADIQKKLRVPIILSPLMNKQYVTLKFDDLPLETALRLLAPEPYIDYVVGGNTELQPKYIAIYLNAMNEPPPPANAGVSVNRDTFVVEGNTEDLTDQSADDSEKPPLHVSFKENKLSVRARKQSLLMVLSEIADKVGIPFDSSYLTGQVVDVEFSDYALEDAVRHLASNVRLYVRTNLQTLENKPLRIDIVAPTKAGH